MPALRLQQVQLTGGMAGAPRAWCWCLALGLLLYAAVGCRAAAADASGLSPPRLTLVSVPSAVVPGQPIRVRIEWALPDLAEPDSTPVADLGETLWRCGTPVRSESGVAWDGDIVPLCPGILAGPITCRTALPLLPADLPHSEVAAVPPRYLANLYSPCRWRTVMSQVPLPPLAVTPPPPLPRGTPPFSGLLGTWSASLNVEQPQVFMGEPFAIVLRLQGLGSAALFREPLLSHPDLEVMAPTVERREEEGVVNVRWTAIAKRVPLEPVRLAFSTLDGGRYACHRLEVALNVRPEPPPQPGAALPPPVLLCFHPLPDAAAPPRGSALAGGLCALAGALVGLSLALAARRRDLRCSPAGLRQAALARLRRMHLAQADDLPRLYHDLRLWLELPAGAAAAEIETALRPEFSELADELRALETQRFSAVASAASPRRLQGLLRQLPCVVVLALLGWRVPAALPPEEALPQVAEEAFRQRDYAQACNALSLLRESGRESPELLVDLANASWFCGRRIEALALYERAVRCAPRRQEYRDGLAWLRRNLPAEATAVPTPWTLPLRDRLRPDEWLLMAGLLLGIGCCAGGLLRWWHRPARHALAVCAAVACGCSWFALAQWTGTYRAGATARLTQAMALRAAPAAVAETLTPVLPAGTLLTPSGAHADWVQVRTSSAEGWVPETGCILVW
jgi:hypothetical protein